MIWYRNWFWKLNNMKYFKYYNNTICFKAITGIKFRELFNIDTGHLLFLRYRLDLFIHI